MVFVSGQWTIYWGIMLIILLTFFDVREGLSLWVQMDSTSLPLLNCSHMFLICLANKYFIIIIIKSFESCDKHYPI